MSKTLPQLTQVTSLRSFDEILVNSNGNPRRAPISALTSYLEETAYVQQDGAVGDGVANDGPAIRAAAARVGAGGVLRFPAGVYLLNNPVLPLARQVWLFDRGAFLKQGPSFTGEGLIVMTQDLARISGASFIGNPSVPRPCVAIGNATGCELHRCYKDGTTQWLVIASNSPRTRVLRCHCDGGIGTHHVEFNASDYCSAEFCILLNSNQNGVEFWQNITGSPVVGCRVIGCHIEAPGQSGIAMVGASECQIVSNTIIGAGFGGISMSEGQQDSTVYPRANLIQNNVIRNSGAARLNAGIHIGAGNAHQILGNDIEGSSLDGIESFVDNCSFSGNVCRLNGRHGIRLANSGAGDNIVTNNICLDNSNLNVSSGHGILVEGPRNIITGNRSGDTRSAKRQGIGIFIRSSGNICTANNVRGNVNAQILDGAGGNTISNNITS